MKKILGKKGINEVHVEAGATLSGDLIQAGLVDELLIYMAPCLLGGGRNMLSIDAVPSLDERINLDIREIVPIGKDLRIIARIIERNKEK